MKSAYEWDPSLPVLLTATALASWSNEARRPSGFALADGLKVTTEPAAADPPHLVAEPTGEWFQFIIMMLRYWRVHRHRESRSHATLLLLSSVAYYFTRALHIDPTQTLMTFTHHPRPFTALGPFFTNKNYCRKKRKNTER